MYRILFIRLAGVTSRAGETIIHVKYVNLQAVISISLSESLINNDTLCISSFLFTVFTLSYSPCGFIIITI